MLAIFKTGGKQYSVKAGQILKVEKLEGNKGDNISFKNVLAVSDASKNTIGAPLIEGAVVEAKILEQIRGNKIIVFKKRKRQNYRSTQGHRQYLTVLQIESISLDGKKYANSKIIERKKPNEKKIDEEKKQAIKKAPKKTAAKKTSAKKKAVKKVVKKTTTKKESK